MIKPVTKFEELTCKQCVNRELLGFEFSFAFQPIISRKNKNIVSYEALVRGNKGEPAASIFKKVNSSNFYRFDQACRVRAIQTAAGLNLDKNLNINFAPNAVYKPETCIRTTFKAAEEYGFPVNRINFEITETEKIKDHNHLNNIIKTYQKLGFTTSIDDFGAGFSGLNMLANFRPDYIKIDRELIIDIDQSRTRQSILRGIVNTCHDLDIQVIAEGIETPAEYEFLSNTGIDLFQGYYFARPAFESLPEVPVSRY